MATNIRLNDSVDLVVELPVADIQAALQEALAEGKLLEVRYGDRVVIINPVQVLYLQEADEADLSAAGTNGVRRSAPAAAAR